MPLLAASGASAAEAPTWDRVAECESGGVWSSNAGNGYYGGLQLTLSTWEKFGGTAYADRPDLASRSQQIAVAEKILNSEGPDAWPGCAVTSGLHEDPTAVPDIDPGDLPAASSSPEADDTSAGATPGGQSESSRSESAQPESTQRESTRQGGGSTQQERGSAPTDGPSGSSQSPAPDRSTPAPATSGAPSTGASPFDSTSPAERGTGRAEQQSPDTLDAAGQADERETAERGAGRSADRALPDDGHVVQTGDSLTAIADQHAVDGGWRALYATNEEVVGSDPDLILPGQRIELETPQG